MQAADERDAVDAAPGIVGDMLAVPGLVRKFDAGASEALSALADHARATGRVHFAGEGSNLTFPPRHALALARRRGLDLTIGLAGGVDSAAMDLARWTVVGLSNSGRTAELVRLFTELERRGHAARGAITAGSDSPLEALAPHTHRLACGAERAVAATMSVVEEALACQALVEATAPAARTAWAPLHERREELASALERTLALEVPSKFLRDIGEASVVYWAGSSDGVAAELALKTIEVVRKRSALLEGTFALHGIEEVLVPGDVILWLDPPASEHDRIREVLVDAAGVRVLAIAERETPFPTLVVPDAGDLAGYPRLVAGWRVLLEAALAHGIDPDHPRRARKIGNEVRPGG